MKKEIKFRAFIKEEKHMEYLHDMMITLLDDINHYGVENSILMQFTGAKDKEGKEIYEGDIIKFSPQNQFGSIDKDKLGVVEWCEHNFAFAVYPTPNIPNSDHYLLRGMHMTIVGNIYENPELLK